MDVLIGSTALSHYLNVDPVDVDYLSDQRESSFGCDVFYDDRLEQWEPWRNSSIATLDELYTLKFSHQFWDLHGTWFKHLGQLQLMKNNGAKLIPELFELLYPIWEDLHGKKAAYLKEDGFFNENVKRVYEHDFIHESIAYYEEPMFRKILKDGYEVVVEEDRFIKLSEEQKLALVREETQVIALERFIIPSDYSTSYTRAYRDAYKMLITQLTKGWFAKFALENSETLQRPDRNYIKVFQEKI